MNPLAARRVEAFDLACRLGRETNSNIKRFRPLTRPSSFLLVDPKRNGTKEKRLPDTSTARGVTCNGIFRLGILPRSENGGHPCPPPSGSGLSGWRHDPGNGNNNAKGKS